jgi:hypothetical protein
LKKKAEQLGAACVSFYFFLALALALAFGFTCFMGAPQHIRSQATQLQFSSTVTTTPHFSHSYVSPFRAIFSPPQTVSLIEKHCLKIKDYDFKVQQSSDN